MKNNELKLNEMEQISGGSFIDDVKDVLKKIFPNPLESPKPTVPIIPEPLIARGKC